MPTNPISSQEERLSVPCLILTATVQVSSDLCFTIRKDPSVRLADYKAAFAKWVHNPHVTAIVFVENSGFDLSEFRTIAKGARQKQIEFLSFKCPPFHGSLGKGYGEMLCLEECLNHSELVNAADRFLKVSGRYYLSNADVLLKFIAEKDGSDVICNFKHHLTWADSRAFGGTVEFLRKYLCPMKDVVNDTLKSEFEHVLARAVHRLMADSGRWSMTPEALRIEGVSATHGRNWAHSPLGRLKQTVKHELISRGISL